MPAHTPEMTNDLENIELPTVTLNAKLSPKDQKVDGTLDAAHSGVTNIVGDDVEM